MSKRNSLALPEALAAALLLGVAAYAGRSYLLHAEAAAAANGAATSTGTTSKPTLAATIAAASGAATPADVAAALAAQQQQLNIQSLRQQLASTWNDMDLTATQLDSIDRQSAPSSLFSDVQAELRRNCQAQQPLITFSWWGGGPTGDPCAAATAAAVVQAEVNKRWAVSQTNSKQPYQAKLSALDSTQHSLIANLAALGFTVPASQVRATK